MYSVSFTVYSINNHSQSRDPNNNMNSLKRSTAAIQEHRSARDTNMFFFSVIFVIELLFLTFGLRDIFYTGTPILPGDEDLFKYIAGGKLDGGEIFFMQCWGCALISMAFLKLSAVLVGAVQTTFFGLALFDLSVGLIATFGWINGTVHESTRPLAIIFLIEACCLLVCAKAATTMAKLKND